ncbi:PREDICTED: collagen alpha-1(I) chain-like, partial [Nicotiana attenuata]|uniref:collagen alpha-1(I) chain-like n=1 Tax=Nicotiana attenuata TaxID=49451 RepID=UPI0009056EE4
MEERARGEETRDRPAGQRRTGGRGRSEDAKAAKRDKRAAGPRGRPWVAGGRGPGASESVCVSGPKGQGGAGDGPGKTRKRCAQGPRAGGVDHCGDRPGGAGPGAPERGSGRQQRTRAREENQGTADRDQRTGGQWTTESASSRARPKGQGEGNHAGGPGAGGSRAQGAEEAARSEGRRERERDAPPGTKEDRGGRGRPGGGSSGEIGAAGYGRGQTGGGERPPGRPGPEGAGHGAPRGGRDSKDDPKKPGARAPPERERRARGARVSARKREKPARGRVESGCGGSTPAAGGRGVGVGAEPERRSGGRDSKDDRENQGHRTARSYVKERGRGRGEKRESRARGPTWRARDHTGPPRGPDEPGARSTEEAAGTAKTSRRTSGPPRQDQRTGGAGRPETRSRGGPNGRGGRVDHAGDRGPAREGARSAEEAGREQQARPKKQGATAPPDKGQWGVAGDRQAKRESGGRPQTGGAADHPADEGPEGAGPGKRGATEKKKRGRPGHQRHPKKTRGTAPPRTKGQGGRGARKRDKPREGQTGRGGATQRRRPGPGGQPGPGTPPEEAAGDQQRRPRNKAPPQQGPKVTRGGQRDGPEKTRTGSRRAGRGPKGRVEVTPTRRPGSRRGAGPGAAGHGERSGTANRTPKKPGARGERGQEPKESGAGGDGSDKSQNSRARPTRVRGDRTTPRGQGARGSPEHGAPEEAAGTAKTTEEIKGDRPAGPEGQGGQGRQKTRTAARREQRAGAGYHAGDRAARQGCGHRAAPYGCAGTQRPTEETIRGHPRPTRTQSTGGGRGRARNAKAAGGPKRPGARTTAG